MAAQLSCVHLRNNPPAWLNSIRGDQGVRAIPHIGTHFERRLRDHGNIQTVAQLVEYFRGQRRRKIKEEMTVMFQNPRRNRCARGRAPPHSPYHVRDVNRCAYAAVLALLRWAKQHRGKSLAWFQAKGFAVKPRFGQVPPRDRQVSSGSRYCSCLTSLAACNAFPDDCVWHGGRCNPRHGPGFPGVLGYPGQRRSLAAAAAGGPVVHGLRYDGVWRRPSGVGGVPNPPMRPRPRRQQRRRR